MSSSLQGKSLRIDALSEEADKIERDLVPLIGSPPSETPTFNYFAHTYVDSRTRSAQTLQLRSKVEKDDIMTHRLLQDAVRGALWTALDGILSKQDLPDINFEECQAPSSRLYSSSDETFGVVNLHFTSDRALQRVRKNLKDISVATQGNKRLVYSLAETSHLEGRIFIFDCLNLHLDGMDVEALFAALKDMTKELGNLLGLAKVVAKPKESPEIQSPSHSVRGYLKLSRPWLAVPLSKLVDQLPYRLLWYGIPHPLLYVGYDRDYRSKKDSADYPLKTSVEDEAKGAKEAKDPSSEAGGEEEEVSTRRSKRRKKAKEE